MPSQFTFANIFIVSFALLAGFIFPAHAEFDVNKQIDGFNKQVEGWNKQLGKQFDEQLDGLSDFMSGFGKDLGSGVRTMSNEVDNMVTGRTRNVVSVSERYNPGTIVVRTSTRKLYYVLSPGRALEYGVGVGRQGFQWGGVSYVSRKQEWPDWRPPKEMIERERVQNNREIPEFMPGGPENPLGARALYLGNTLYRIHGTNEAQTIGGAVSSGCIRMRNKDVIDLYERVAVGSKVYVYH
ncbi:MAG: L,D-transpeptidase [Hyphomicrobiales bacterium]